MCSHCLDTNIYVYICDVLLIAWIVCNTKDKQRENMCSHCLDTNIDVYICDVLLMQSKNHL